MIKEVDRYRQGIIYGRTAIQNHSCRVYSHTYDGLGEVTLDRMTEVVGDRQWEAFHFDNGALSTPLKIEGLDKVRTWKQAEKVLEQFIKGLK